MPARTPEERALVARIANATRLATTADHGSLTADARRTRRAQFEAQALAACPGLSGADLARRADDLQRAHMLRMTLASTRGRRKARENTAEAEAAEEALRDLGGGAA